MVNPMGHWRKRPEHIPKFKLHQFFGKDQKLSLQQGIGPFQFFSIGSILNRLTSVVMVHKAALLILRGVYPNKFISPYKTYNRSYTTMVAKRNIESSLPG
ncbi:hypothetical protein AVEN_225080-1 [Araneus ventricosus]|uniref:Uncharacterized protein n=1 Tax=Araneus ventricosus TaxID=182803 RepID=A0A4Y2MTJ9_ARAVE|nr:hypothetical protein AVEN_225080-1 [Araneus ventricosus]